MNANDSSQEELTKLTQALLEEHLRDIGYNGPEITHADIEFFVKPYESKFRTFHDSAHRREMGQPNLSKGCAGALQYSHLFPSAKVLSALAGQAHDLVYLEAGPIHPVVKEKLEAWVDVDHFTLTEQGRKDPTVQLVSTLFAQGLDEPLTKGKNEFLSALATAKLLKEKGISDQMIAAVTVMIAGTIPFQPNHRAEEYTFDGGYFEALADRLRTTELGHDAKVVDDIITVAVDIANRDIASFYGEWQEMVAKGFRLNMELDEGLRGKQHVTMRDMLKLSKPGIYRKIASGEIPAHQVVHRYKNYPPDYEAKVAKVEENAQKAVSSFDRKRVGTAIAAAIAELIDEPEILVQDLVGGEKWRDLHAKIPGDMPMDQAVFSAFTYMNYTDAEAKTIAHAPIAAKVYKDGGERAMQKMQFFTSKREQFTSKKDAESYLKQATMMIGLKPMQEIIQMLAEIATEKEQSNRANKLQNLPTEIGLDQSLSFSRGTT